MSALSDHICDQQTIACQLSDLLEIAEACLADDIKPTAQMTLIVMAKDLANRLIDGLDSAKLPKEGRA